MLADKLRAASVSEVPPPIFISASTGNAQASTTVVVPALTGVEDGDLLVAVIAQKQTARELAAVPAGFSLLSQQVNGTGYGLSILSKVASAESGTYTFTLVTSTDLTATILVYRDARYVDTIGTMSASSSTAPSITPNMNGTLVAAFAQRNNDTVTTPPSGMTQVSLYTADQEPLAIYELEDQAAGVATGDKTIVWTSPSSPYGIQLLITNEPDTAPEFVAVANTHNPIPATTLVINKPTGTVEGDFMIAVMGTDGNNTWTGDTGWTEIVEQGSRPSLRIAYKTAGAAEASSYTFTTTSSVSVSGSILTYRNGAIGTVGAITTSNDPLSIPSITIGSGDSRSILLASAIRSSSSVTVTIVGMTPVVVDNNSTSPSYTISSQRVPAGATGTRSATLGSSTNVAGVLVSIRPI